MKALNRITLFCLLLAASGCASVPMSSLSADKEGKSFVVPPDRSAIYLYRNELFGGAMRLTVALDGRLAGQTAADTYFLWIVKPGEHRLDSMAENASSITITTAPGKAYFVWQEIKMGLWTARTQLHEVDEHTGRQAVNECSRVASEF